MEEELTRVASRSSYRAGSFIPLIVQSFLASSSPISILRDIPNFSSELLQNEINRSAISRWKQANNPYAFNPIIIVELLFRRKQSSAVSSAAETLERSAKLRGRINKNIPRVDDRRRGGKETLNRMEEATTIRPISIKSNLRFSPLIYGVPWKGR